MTRIIGGFILVALAVGALVLALSGNWDALRHLFTANDNLSGESGTLLIGSTLVVVICDALIVALWRWRPTRAPKACGALNPKFDPRSSFFKYFTLGSVGGLVCLACAAILAGEPLAFLVAGVVWAIHEAALFVLLLFISAQPCRRAFSWTFLHSK